jgi:hypothetical protein
MFQVKRSARLALLFGVIEPGAALLLAEAGVMLTVCPFVDVGVHYDASDVVLDVQPVGPPPTSVRWGN